MTERIDVREAEAHITEVLSRVAAGDEIVLTRDDRPLARLVPVEPESRERIPGLHAGAIQMCEDFDAPLPDEFWTGGGDPDRRPETL